MPAKTGSQYIARLRDNPCLVKTELILGLAQLMVDALGSGDLPYGWRKSCSFWAAAA